VDSSAGMGVLNNRHVSCLYRDSNPKPLGPKPSLYTGYAFPTSTNFAYEFFYVINSINK